MLKVFSSMEDLDFSQLASVYDYSFWQAEDFRAYLSDVFFDTKGAVYCVWEHEGTYLSALRLEPFRDGMILAGLETHRAYRNRGHATALLQAALQWAAQQGMGKIYAHIHYRNTPSIHVHHSCGFQKIAACATMLDGTVTSRFGTYLFENK